jgi:hypothetical protein
MRSNALKEVGRKENTFVDKIGFDVHTFMYLQTAAVLKATIILRQ